jgi:hypothetical protein
MRRQRLEGGVCPAAQTESQARLIVWQMFVEPVQALLPNNFHATSAAGWSTSSFGSAADTSSVDSLSLSEHLDRCRRSRGALFAALCLADAVYKFLAPRLVTTVAVLALLVGVAFGLR